MPVFKLIDYSSSLVENEVSISTEEDLRKALIRFQQLYPQFVDLISPSGDCLTIGIGDPYSCVMYSQSSGDPPYLWALGNIDNTEDFIEFDASGTPTPVPLYRCLPFNKVVEIAVYFFGTGSLPQNVKWDED